MSDLSGSDFAQYFQDVHCHPPFPWQKRLTTDVLETGRWPDVIDLPTGTGKTAVLDTAIFSLAMRPEIFPRRVVFVVDRRIIVDQVRIRALRIQKRLKSGKTEVLRQVKTSLAVVGEENILGVSALRGGGMPIDREWSRRPDLPWVVVSTVDQFGSRLLFNGYGVSRTSRPIHAGLAGNDCLVILDEVHLSQPFSETLDAVNYLPRGPLPRRFHVVKMSATPEKAVTRRFELVPADLTVSNELRRRVHAYKSAELRTVPGKTKPPHEALPPQILRILKRELAESVRCIGIVLNRVRTARETYQVLTKAGIKSYLVTGRMRPIDRQDILDQFTNAVDPDRQPETGDLTVVVATQTIEVGADYSFDALITECAPVDSLRQRFGRLDRRGTIGTSDDPARGWILGVPSSLNSKRPDSIYGEALRITWENLQQLAANTPDGLIDVGPLALSPESFPDEANAPKPNAPLLLRTYMEAWVQTNPEPIIRPPIAWFLHGIEHDSDPDVTLVWRKDRSLDALRLVPPRPGEYLQVPISAARAWLMAQAETDVADVDVLSPSGNSVVSTSDKTIEQRYIRWEGKETGKKKISPLDIRPGDVIVVDPSRGGLRGKTWDPSSTSVVDDLGDPAQLPGRTATLRLHPRYLGENFNPPRPADEANAHEPRRQRIDQWLNRMEDLPAWAEEFICRVKGRSEIHAANDWKRCRPSCNPKGVKGRFRIDTVDPHKPSEGIEDSYYTLTERTVDLQTFDGSDLSSSFTGAWITLRDHLDGVGTRAADFGRQLGFPDEIVNSLRLAGRLHDLGKVDRRFQSFLVSGDPVRMQTIEDTKEPLAKSPYRLSSGRHNSVPHPITGVALVLSNPLVFSEHEPCDRDLVLHLIATHHGYGRPLLAIGADPNPQELRFNLDGHYLQASSDLAESTLALDHAERFWLLNERYGYHGLAWLEAVLRLADWHESAREQRRFEEGHQ